MQIPAETVEEYLEKVPAERQVAFRKLIETIRENIPEDFTETVQYSMPSWNISLADYPPGYHCTPDTPLPFLSIASQKNSVNLYHMGIYMDFELMEWFTSEFPNHSKRKLDMGKSCIRFKNVDDIPYKLIGELVQKMTSTQYINLYESAFTKKKPG